MADPVKAVIDEISGIAGISTYMPSFYRSRAEGSTALPYGVVEKAETSPLADFATFDGAQPEQHILDIAFWTASPADCRAWGELVKANVSDWGTIVVAGYGTIAGVERGRMSYAEERPPNTDAGLAHVCRVQLTFMVDYTPTLG